MSSGVLPGTVQAPFFAPNMRQTFNDDYRIPVLIRIEPERLKMQLGEMRMLLSTWRIVETWFTRIAENRKPSLDCMLISISSKYACNNRYS